MTRERLILSEVRVHGRGERPVDVLLEDGRVARFVPPGTASGGERLGLEGAVVLPGLWDHHVHLQQWAQTRRRLDLSGTSSAAETLAAVRAALDAAPGASEALIGYGFRDGLWPDAPGPGMLDLGDRPIQLISADLHAVWVNRAAMAAAGRPGHPGGLLREEEAFALTRALSMVDEATMDAWVLDAARAAAARGVVGVVDLEMAGALPAWRRRAGSVPLRVHAGVYPDALEEEAARGMRTGVPLDEAGRAVVGPLKLITDGSLNTRTAWCHDPYPDGGHGQPTWSPEELEALVRRGTELGFELAIHAIGDRAAAVALDAVEVTGARGSIEHAQLLSREDVPRLARLGLVASVQPEHAMDDRDVAEHHWAGRTGRAFPLRALREAGVRLALGSDAPVAPLDPWQAIQAAAERSRDGREPWHPEQRIDVASAVAASTRTGGVVAVGDPADLVVVPEDPLARSGRDLREMPVLLTLLAGEITADLR